jgi:hypothetical protein
MGPAELGALIPIVAIIGGCAVAIFRPLVAAYARQLDKKQGVAPEVTARLERMEQSLDAIAVEIERITEGQRFTTRLLAERTGGSAHASGSPVPASEQRS